MSRILVVDDDRTTRHVLRKLLTNAGFSATVARDGVEALKALRSHRFDLLLLDVWMPRMNGLDLLARLRKRKARPRVVVMTSDDAPETLLKAVREQAFKYVHKPVDSRALLQTVREVLKSADAPPIEVISARPDWVELVVPCTREAAEHIQMVMAQLDANLEPELRESIAYALRELLLNAIEWGGRLDPTRTVRIACLRARRMLMYRIADPGRVQPRGSVARGDRPRTRRADRAHAGPRGEGNPARWFRSADGPRQRRRASLQRKAE
jgi:CheY-like chemotaxis protein